MDKSREKILKEIPSGGTLRATIIPDELSRDNERYPFDEFMVYGLYQFFLSPEILAKELQWKNSFEITITPEAKRWVAKYQNISLKELEKINGKLVKDGWAQIELKENGNELITLFTANN